MFERIVKAILNYFLHRGIDNSDIKQLSIDVKKVNGNYVVDIFSTVKVATKGEQIREENGNRKLTIVFLGSLSIMVILIVTGMLLPAAGLGRTLVYLGTFPGILVNAIATRYIIKSLT
jgi:hypothetical protein